MATALCDGYVLQVLRLLVHHLRLTSHSFRRLPGLPPTMRYRIAHKDAGDSGLLNLAATRVRLHVRDNLPGAQQILFCQWLYGGLTCLDRLLCWK